MVDRPVPAAQGDVAAQAGEAVEGVGVADAAEDDFDAGGVPDGLGSGGVPAGFELGQAVADRDDQDALAGAIGHPQGERDWADLGYLVQCYLQPPPGCL